MSVARSLYRLLHRAAREHRRASLPLVGVVGFASDPVLDVRELLASAFRGRGLAPAVAADAAQQQQQQQQDGDEGFRALRQVQQQLQVLKSAEEETREALRQWQLLCGAWASAQVPPPPAAPPLAGQHPVRQRQRSPAAGVPAADFEHQCAQLRRLSAALEDGALLVEQLYNANHNTLLDELAEHQDEHKDQHEPGTDSQHASATSAALDTGAGGEASSPRAAAAAAAAAATQRSGAEQVSSEVGPCAAALPDMLQASSVAATRRRLDELAHRIASRHPALFAGGAGGPAGRPVGQRELQRLRLEAISEELLRGPNRFRHDPVEWVYDGLAPVLMSQLLSSHRGIPLSLALLVCCVAARLGLGLVPVKAVAAGHAPNIEQGPVSLHNLPPEVAARQGARSVALAPQPDCWLVVALCPTGEEEVEAQAQGQAQREGGARAGAPSWLVVDVDRRGAVLGWEQARERYRGMLPSASELQLPSCPVQLWCELARVLLTAHMRRGESDLVAHWLLQVLALDHRAPEWRAVMRS